MMVMPATIGGVEWRDVGRPLYAGSILSTMDRLPQVQELRLITAVPRQSAADFIVSPSFPCSNLEVVILERIIFFPDIFRTLANLPKLRRLEINDTAFGLLGMADKMGAEATLLAAACRAEPTSFSSLRSLIIRSWTFFYAGLILQFLPPGCKLEHLKVTCPCDIHPGGCQIVIDVIQHYCNPHSLRSLEFYDCTKQDERLPREPLDVDLDDDENRREDVDLWNLSQFTELTTLVIRCGGEMRLRREDIPKFVETWPHLQHLDLCSMQYSHGRMPAFDHHNVLNIVQGLRHLGLRFDTTQLPSEQTAPSPTSPSLQLLTLRVGESHLTRSECRYQGPTSRICQIAQAFRGRITHRFARACHGVH